MEGRVSYNSTEAQIGDWFDGTIRSYDSTSRSRYQRLRARNSQGAFQSMLEARRELAENTGQKLLGSREATEVILCGGRGRYHRRP